MGKIKSIVSDDKTEIDRKEEELKQGGFQRVQSMAILQLNQYFRNEWVGNEKSFEGTKKYQIDWCEPE